MKTQKITILDVCGESDVQIPALGSNIRLNCDANHEDWQACLTNITKWPTIPKGSEVTVVGWKQNHRGLHLQVTYKIRDYDINLECFNMPMFH